MFELNIWKPPFYYIEDFDFTGSPNVFYSVNATHEYYEFVS